MAVRTEVETKNRIVAVVEVLTNDGTEAEIEAGIAVEATTENEKIVRAEKTASLNAVVAEVILINESTEAEALVRN